MQIYNQLDPKWSKEKIGKSGLRLGRWGCTVTAICMAASKFKPDEQLSVTPDVFVRQYGKFTSKGLIIWGSSKYPRMQFVKRVVGYPSSEVLSQCANNPDLTVIVEVDHYHWLALDKVSTDNLFVFGDPWGGVRIQNFKKSRYKKITKYVIFERIK